MKGNTMTPTSYIVHLPSGRVIVAKDGQNLDLILSLNVCRVWQARQLRIEPVYDRRDSSLSNSQKQVKITEFERGLVGDSAGDVE
jgi:hypothetical protein